MDIKRLMQHPEYMDRETLYELRSLVALHPYYQTARILLLQNLYILHDPAFDEELRKTAICITDRHILFNMIEAAHYKVYAEKATQTRQQLHEVTSEHEDRTTDLIDTFLDSIPEGTDGEPVEKQHHPTPADATVDYVSYLLRLEKEELEQKQHKEQDRTTTLINSFMEDGGFNLQTDDEDDLERNYPTSHKAEDLEEEAPAAEAIDHSNTEAETEKALEIIKRLNLNNPKKNAYFADQIRFLEKLIINNKNK